MSTNISEKVKKKNWTLIIAILSLIIAFSQVGLFDILSFFGGIITPKPDYEIKTYSTPSPFEIERPLI